MKHTTDEAIIKEKIKQTFTHRQAMVHDPVKSSEIFTTFPRFLDIAGMMEQDFRLMFGDDISAKFLEKWPTFYMQKVLKESRGLTQTSDLQDLLHNAESTLEQLENGWDSEMPSILLMIHLMPPSPQGKNKRPGKLSARQAIDHLVKFIKTGTSVEGHLDSITESLQPYLLAVGTQKSAIHKYFVVIDKHAIPSAARQFDPKLTDKDYSETVDKWLRYVPDQEGGISRNRSDPNPSQANQSQT